MRRQTHSHIYRFLHSTSPPEGRIYLGHLSYTLHRSLCGYTHDEIHICFSQMKTLLCWFPFGQWLRTSWFSDWPPSTNPHIGGVGHKKVGIYAGDQLLLLQVLARCIWHPVAQLTQPLGEEKTEKLKMRHYGNKSVKVLLFTAPFLISVLLGSEWVLGSWLELNADTDISRTVVCIWAQKKKKKERNSYTFKKSIIFECQCSI